MNRPKATGAVTHGRVFTAGQAAQRRTVLDVEAAIECEACARGIVTPIRRVG
jgi:hypothetical protein